MKKLLAKISLITALTLFTFTPVAVLAQEGVIDVGGGDTTTLPETGAGVPDTGIAPTENKAVQNIAVFAGGSLLGVGIGLGVIKLRKNSLDKS